MIAPAYPDILQLFDSAGVAQCTIYAGDAKRLVKRGLAELVLDHGEIAGIICTGGIGKPSHPKPKLGHNHTVTITVAGGNCQCEIQRLPSGHGVYKLKNCIG